MPADQFGAAAMRFGDGGDNRQAETGASLAGTRNLREEFEHPFCEFRRNARTRIGHCQESLAASF